MGLGAPSFGWDFRPRSGTYLMNVYSIVKVLVKGFRPSSGRSRERQKIKPRRKVFKNFFMGPPFKLIWKQRKIKKTQLPPRVAGSRSSWSGIKRDKQNQTNTDGNIGVKDMCARLVWCSWGGENRLNFPLKVSPLRVQKRVFPSGYPI